MKFVRIVCIALFTAVLGSCGNELVEAPVKQGNQLSFRLSKSSDSMGDDNALDEGNGGHLAYKILFYKADKADGTPSISNDDPINYENFYLVKEVEGWKSYEGFVDFQFSIKNENLEDYIYQLVVIATTKIKHEIDFELGSEHDGKSLLSELKVKRMYESVNGEQVLIPLSKDNYICSRQITQADINSGEVELKLQRMVGQLIFDIGKYGENGPVALDAEYGSTLDRVYNITFSIHNFTESFAWFGKGESVASSTKKISEETENTAIVEKCSYSLSKYFSDNTGYKMDWNKMPTSLNGEYGIIVDSHLSASPTINDGATRIYGPYEFSSSSGNLQMEMNFEYYDTDISPLIEKSLILRLPKANSKITVVPNFYTYSKIKIRENRIIDVPVDFGDLKFDNEWKNDYYEE